MIQKFFLYRCHQALSRRFNQCRVSRLNCFEPCLASRRWPQNSRRRLMLVRESLHMQDGILGTNFRCLLIRALYQASC